MQQSHIGDRLQGAARLIDIVRVYRAGGWERTRGGGWHRCRGMLAAWHRRANSPGVAIGTLSTVAVAAAGFPREAKDWERTLPLGSTLEHVAELATASAIGRSTQGPIGADATAASARPALSTLIGRNTPAGLRLARSAVLRSRLDDRDELLGAELFDARASIPEMVMEDQFP